MEDVFFIDINGNKVYSDTIESHIGLAKLMIEENKQLAEEYNISKTKDLVDFLVLDKGYLKVSNIGYYKVIAYSSKNLSEKQTQLIEYYNNRGYTLDDLDITKLKDEQLR